MIAMVQKVCETKLGLDMSHQYVDKQTLATHPALLFTPQDNYPDC